MLFVFMMIIPPTQKWLSMDDGDDYVMEKPKQIGDGQSPEDLEVVINSMMLVMIGG